MFSGGKLKFPFFDKETGEKPDDNSLGDNKESIEGQEDKKKEADKRADIDIEIQADINTEPLNNEENITNPDVVENETIATLTGQLSLDILDYEYSIIDDDWAKVTSVTFRVTNGASNGLYPLILIYLYGEEDDSSIKGLVRDQINIGTLVFPGKTITRTDNIDADIKGDLTTGKTFKLSLVNSYEAHSETLAYDTAEINFLG